MNKDPLVVDLLKDHKPTIFAPSYDQLRDEVKRLTPLAKFGESVLDEVKECVTCGGYEIAAETLADRAVELGFFQWIPYDPDKHGEVECDPGDKIYYWGKPEGDDE